MNAATVRFAAKVRQFKFFVSNKQSTHKEWQTMARKLVVGIAVLALLTAFTVPASPI